MGWLAFGAKPRAANKAERLLGEGRWEGALSLVREQQNLGQLSPAWQDRFRAIEGACYRHAGEEAKDQQRYEDALDYLLSAGRLLAVPEDEIRGRLIGIMLSEARALFAKNGEPDQLHKLLARIRAMQASCLEAAFWQGLCHLRQGELEQARVCLTVAVETSGARAEQRFVDPPFYLGILALKEGRTQDAVRHLSDANRLGSGSVLVLLQLGQALIAAKGDTGLAARALQRAVGPDGLPRFARTPEKVWIDGLPEGRSYVRKLAATHTYSCPLLGGSVARLIRQGQFALGQAQLRQGNFQHAANLFTLLMQDSPPTPALARGLGIALARLERYEDAFKHLRFAHDTEEPANALTTGYLALCGARGKPTQPEDKLKNVTWALRLINQVGGNGEAEWPALCSAVYAEARAAGVPITIEEQRGLCATLAAVESTSADAAAAYEHLATTDPESLRPEHAWLYCRAVQQHGCAGPRVLDLFASAFRDEPALRAYASTRQWDLKELQVAFLTQAAAANRDSFPEVLGVDFPARGTVLLLERSQRQEVAGQHAAALASAEVLVRLAPRDPAGIDRLASLCYRQGDLHRAAVLLRQLHDLVPEEPLPLARLAIVEEQRGDWAGCSEAITRGLAKSRGRGRAAFAMLGARLALAARQMDTVVAWLHDCLMQDPDHAEALWVLAAIRSVRDDEQGLAAQAAAMLRPDVTDPRFQYLSAVCHLAAGQQAQVLDATRRAAADEQLTADCAYLDGRAAWMQHDLDAAVLALEQAAQGPPSTAREYAQALLGTVLLARGEDADAVGVWTSLDPATRASWNLDETLRDVAFLSAVTAFESEHYELAIDRLREAGRLGCRDRRLGMLLIRSLVNAAKRQLTDASKIGPAALLLDQAIKAGCRDPRTAELLALALKRQGKPKEARAALERVLEPDAFVFLQRGVLALADKQLDLAEREFNRALHFDPNLYEAMHNLLHTRLSLGKFAAAAELLPRVRELAHFVDEKQCAQHLEVVLRWQPDQRGAPELANLSPDEEARLLAILRSPGRLDLTYELLRSLVRAIPNSKTCREALAEAEIVTGSDLLQRGDWVAAERLLVPVAKVPLPRATQAALLNLLGCAACLGQSFQEGAELFQEALRKAGADPRLQQNLALSYEWQGQFAKAESHWNLYFDQLGPRLPAPANWPEYHAALARAGLNRLATFHTDRQNWGSAITFAQRSHELQPDDSAALERLFQLLGQAGRQDDAQRLLRRLRQSRPNDPQIDLYELSLIKVKNLEDIERLLSGIEKLLRRSPVETRVESHATNLAANVIPLIARLCNQLSEQMGKVLHQVRHLPEHQINWRAVREVLRDLRVEFRKLRQITTRCLPLVRAEEQRRQLHELSEQLDRKMEHCQSAASR